MAFSILYAINGFCVVNKPPDVAMDGYGQDDSKLTVDGWVSSEAGRAALIAAGAIQREEPKHQDDDGNNGGAKKPVVKIIPDAQQTRLRFVHQLDYATSGLLCLAFSKAMAQRVSFCFESRQPRKEYISLVDGWVLPELIVSAKHNPQLARCCKLICSEGGAEANDYCIDEESVGALPLEAVLSHFSPELRKLSCPSSPSSSSSERGVMRRLLVSCPIGIDPTDEKNFRMRAVFPLSPSSVSGENNDNRRQRDDVENRNDDDGDGNAESQEKRNIKGSSNNNNKNIDAKEASTIVTVVAHGFLRQTVGENAQDADDDGKGTGQKKRKRRVSLIHLQLLTGRRHQLRVHCSAVLGAPIVGDVAYEKIGAATGGSACDADEPPRMMLHAWRLSLPQAALAGGKDAREEKDQKKVRRREIKQVRAAAAAAAASSSEQRTASSTAPVVGSKAIGKKDHATLACREEEEEEEEEEDGEHFISFVAPESLTQFFEPV